MAQKVTRRGFLREAPGAAVVGVLAPVVAEAVELPKKAYVILGQAWDDSDEGSYTIDGSYLAGHTVYYDKAEADAACKLKNDEFFKTEDPTDFQLDWCLPDDFDDDCNAADAEIWAAAREGGFADPFEVEELGHTPPGAKVE